MIYLSADHGGYELKKVLITYLLNKDLPVEDMGPFEYKPEDDYPDYVIPLAKKVGESAENCGILICRNGVGVSMLANKFKGIRCALSWKPDHAKSSRTDDNTNVLALPADYITQAQALDIVEAWLTTPFSNEERHKARLKKIMEVEK